MLLNWSLKKENKTRLGKLRQKDMCVLMATLCATGSGSGVVEIGLLGYLYTED